ncbi:hypothetical protein H5410_007263 [Solanum commersonii]|uniref:Uncharacterized protein n=1 Tax=Solanum commersonii TaxID=4109 RepID=A0A9J6ABL7_SOLCO|nr:hypothetical protein H5410_007263 [Solanum commersonii]
MSARRQMLSVTAISGSCEEDSGDFGLKLCAFFPCCFTDLSCDGCCERWFSYVEVLLKVILILKAAPFGFLGRLKI